MATEWFYESGGQKRGPVGSADLKRLAESGVLTPSDRVWKEGLANWVAASSIKGLFSAAPATVPPSRPSLTPPPPTHQAIHPQRIALAVAACLGGAATFMPWANLPIVGNIDGTVGDGWVTLGLFAIALAAAFLGNRSEAVGGFAQLSAIIASVIAAGIGVHKITTLNSLVSQLQGDAAEETLEGAIGGLMAQSIRPQFGLYLLILAGVLCPLLLMMLRPRQGALSLPLHLQRIAAIVLSGIGLGFAFMP